MVLWLVRWYMSKMCFLVAFYSYKILLRLNQNFCFELSCGSLTKNRGRKSQSISLSPPAGCGGELFGPTGAFTSPGYPDKYPANRECIWHIQTSPGSSISITILEFDVEYHPDCNYDKLEVWKKKSIKTVSKIYVCTEYTLLHLQPEPTSWDNVSHNAVHSTTLCSQCDDRTGNNIKHGFS